VQQPESRIYVIRKDLRDRKRQKAFEKKAF
jgi:hypothetical protein